MPRRQAWLLLLAALVAFVVAVTGLRPGGWWGQSWRPALPTDASSVPLGTPQAAPDGAGGYRLLHLQDDGTRRPVTWDPCRPIHYVIRTEGEVPGGREAIDWALARMHDVTGFTFVLDGTTEEVPRARRPAVDRDRRYGARWSPVLFAWTDDSEYPGMHGYAALGGPVEVDGAQPGQKRYVSGVVLLNSTHLAEVAARPDGGILLRAVILHELGHLLGLDHVQAPAELMSPRPGVEAWDLADGDRRGLARLARGPCFSDF